MRPARSQAPQAWPVRLVMADTVVEVAEAAEAEAVAVVEVAAAEAEVELEEVVEVAAGWAVRVVGRAEEAWLPQTPERAWEEHRR